MFKDKSWAEPDYTAHLIHKEHHILCMSDP